MVMFLGVQVGRTYAQRGSDALPEAVPVLGVVAVRPLVQRRVEAEVVYAVSPRELPTHFNLFRRGQKRNRGKALPSMVMMLFSWCFPTPFVSAASAALIIEPMAKTRVISFIELLSSLVVQKSQRTDYERPRAAAVLYIIAGLIVSGNCPFGRLHGGTSSSRTERPDIGGEAPGAPTPGFPSKTRLHIEVWNTKPYSCALSVKV